MAFAGLLFIALAALALVGLVILGYRLARGPRVEQPSCANCRYAVVGLPGHICPECGSDLRVVGILQPGSIRPMGRLGWLIVWTCLLPLPAFIVSSVLIARVQPWTVTSQRLTLGMPGSRAFLSLQMISPSTGAMPATAGPQDLLVTLNALDGSKHDLLVSARNDLVTWTDLAGTSIRHEGPLTKEVLTDWMKSLGIDAESDAVSYEIGQIVQNLGAIGKPVPGMPAGLGVRGGVSITNLGSKGFSSVSSGSSSTSRMPPHLWTKAIAGSAGAWLLGVLLILFLARPRRRPPTMPSAETNPA